MNPVKQEVVNVQGSTALVKSNKGNIYPVVISDFVRIERSVKKGDIGLVKKVNGKWYLTDVVVKYDETDCQLAEVPVEDIIGDY